MEKVDKPQHMIIDQTLLSTPKPKACSTNKKQREIRDDLLCKFHIPINTTFSRESSTVLSLNDVDLTPTLERPRDFTRNHDNSILSMQLKKQRDLATGVLSGKVGLTSMYLNSMVKSEKKLRKESESTMNDSDFLSNVSTRSFYPNDISTPRNSDLININTSGLNIAGNISILADQIKNTDISIKDLCEQYESSLNKPDTSGFNETFLSSPDAAANIILQDEKAWRLQYDAIPQPIHDSIFSNLRESLITDEKSMGEFFKLKSDDCSGIFMKQSPEKDTSSPSALISNSIMLKNNEECCKNYIDENKSLADYNVSDIVRLLANESMSKSCLVECLVNRGCRGEKPAICVVKTNDSAEEQQFVDKTAKIFVNSRGNDVLLNISDVSLAKFNKIELQKSPSPKKINKTEFIENQSRGKNVLLQTINASPPKRNKNNKIEQKSPQKIHTTKFTQKSNNPSPKSHKIDYTDTFTSELLLYGSKSSIEGASDKENTAIVNNVSPNRSVTSLRSGSSLDYLVGGRVPIESTKTELIWATVKVGKSAAKEFVLRNKMHQKIRFQITVSGSCFKIVKTESESQTPISILLHPLESRSFTVTFTPSAIGAYADRLIFQPITKTQSAHDKPSQKILLYGYGGHISPTIRNLLKDSTGKYWLPLGHIDDITTISDIVTKYFIITNNGSLATFVDVTVSLKYLQVFTGLNVTPTMAVIPVGASQQFQVTYVPNKDDFRRLKYGGQFSAANVCEVVVIKCVFGSEVLRARIRRLAAKLDAQMKPTDALLSRLIKPFSREIIPADINIISESVASVKYLIQNLISSEIIVTVEQDMDKTLVAGHNDSSSFQTLCFDITSDVVVAGAGAAVGVYPKGIVLCPRVKCSDVVFLVNSGDKVICFEVRATKDLVRVEPQSGNIAPMNNAMINVACKDDICRNECLKVIVSTEGYSCDVDVQIMCFD